MLFKLLDAVTIKLQRKNLPDIEFHSEIELLLVKIEINSKKYTSKYQVNVRKNHELIYFF